MTRTRFHQGLDELKQRLLIMGGLAEQAVDRAIHAYATRDLQLCKKVLEEEKAINASEREIDEIAVDLLAMQQPMAIDLRFLFSVIKINADLERVGDQAVNIAERIHRIRRRRDYQREGGAPQPESLLDVLTRLKAQGVEAGELLKWLERLQVEPVFTAHPTEAVRRSLLEKEQSIVRALVDNFDPTRTPQERKEAPTPESS